MKKLLPLGLVLFGLFLCGSARAANPTLVQSYHSGHVKASVCTSPCTISMFMPNPTLANNLLHIWYSACGTSGCNSLPPSVTITDDKSNTWTVDATESNGTDFIRSEGFHSCGAAAGTQKITFTFAAGSFNDFTFDFNEYSGVDTTSSCVTTSGASPVNAIQHGNSPVTISPGSLTTTAASLVVSYCAYVTNGLWSSSAANITNSASAVFTSSANLDSATMANGVVQSSSGAITPGFTVTGANTQNFNCLGTAFKASAGSGTNASGARVASIVYTAATPNAAQLNLVPTLAATGTNNALGVLDSNISQDITAISDTSSNSYTIIPSAPANTKPSAAYSCLTTTINPLRTTVTTGTLSGQWYMIYVLTGVQSSCFDQSARASGSRTSGQPVTATNLITPNQSGVVLTVNGFGVGPPSSISAPSGASLDCMDFTGNDDTNKFCNGDGYGHFNNSSATAQTLTWQMGANAGATTSWSALALAFKSASGSGPVPGFNKEHRLEQYETLRRWASGDAADFLEGAGR